MIHFEVFHDAGDTQISLGSCSVDSSQIINLYNQAKELTLPLQNKSSSGGGILNLQMRYLPDAMTRVNFHLYQRSHNLVEPEAYLHYKSLLDLNMYDRFGYQVCLGVYNWMEALDIIYLEEFPKRIRPLKLRGLQEYSKNIKSIKR